MFTVFSDCHSDEGFFALLIPWNFSIAEIIVLDLKLKVTIFVVFEAERPLFTQFCFYQAWKVEEIHINMLRWVEFSFLTFIVSLANK